MAKDIYSTRFIAKELLNQLLDSVKNVKGWGSVEVFIQNYRVTQITEKSIKKANLPVNTKSSVQEL